MFYFGLWNGSIGEWMFEFGEDEGEEVQNGDFGECGMFLLEQSVFSSNIGCVVSSFNCCLGELWIYVVMSRIGEQLVIC